jgi:hydrogenase expression/formation protein HypE
MKLGDAMPSRRRSANGGASYLGKPPDSVFDVIFSHLGAKADGLLVPPGRGLDNGVLRLTSGRILAYTMDPISYIPTIGVARSAWLSVHHLASDIATSGLTPRYSLVNYNVPEEMEDTTLGEYVTAFGEECRKLGVSILGGHTGRYPGCGLTIIGASAFFSEAGETKYVTPAMSESGDRVIVTKGPAIEATAVLAHSFPVKIREAAGRNVLKAARARISQCSTFEDSLAATSVGLREEGVTSMHDATEGGVVSALSELAVASGNELMVDLSRLPVPHDVSSVCSLFGLDPFATLSEGTLILTCKASKAKAIGEAMEGLGIPSFEVGVVGPRMGGAGVRREAVARVTRPVPREMYWDVYSRGIREGWK